MSINENELAKTNGKENGKSDYTADSIQVLEGLEAVRMRPAM